MQGKRDGRRVRRRIRVELVVGSRRAFSLIELLIASICTLAVVTAGTTMVVAVGYVTCTGTADQSTATEGHGAVRRINKLLREARLIGYYDNSNLVLWTKDNNSNDAIELDETAVLWRDAGSEELRLTTPFARTATSAEIAAGNRGVSVAELSDGAFPATIQGASGAETTVLAGRVDSMDVKGNAPAGQAQVAHVSLFLKADEVQKEFNICAGPRAPADYLTSSSLNTNDGRATKHKRRLNPRVWIVP
ncbi:MAG: hypothetical protein HUU22_05965 [Phycisphaerae bacterium]|nr:hypothetical protein [Phycisphaerae bacterium]NUQ45559.1 hypothetical protein [Phycisphaerae bacterium]